jgi:hypothetical protein
MPFSSINFGTRFIFGYHRSGIRCYATDCVTNQNSLFGVCADDWLFYVFDFYSAYFDVVKDCGCFGALHLTLAIIH